MLPVIWDRRTRLVLVASQWVALALGIFASFAAEGPNPITIAAAGTAGLFVLGSTSAPPDWFRRQLVLDIWVLASVILTLIAVTLTGSADSPYLLLAITPTLWAGIFGGHRQALSTALLASGLLLLIELGLEQPDGSGVLLVGGIQLLLAISISQVRRVLVEMERRQEQMVLSQEVSNRRLEQLEDTHDLLTRLEELTASQDTNPIKLGKTALESLVSRFPGTAAAAAIASDKGPVLVARVGNEPPQSQRLTIPLRLAGRETGWIMLATPRALSQSEIDGIEQSLRPLTLAFSNVRLLEMIAQKAISEERVRIARELHDELGPSLASLGLGIDLAMVQNTPDQPLTDQLTHLRRSVSFLVDDIRKTVADLRSEPEPSLSASITEHLTKLDPYPEVQLDIEENRPPRPSISQELTAIVTEAIRNSSRHAHARTIKVSGVVDFDRGRISIADDGRGFDKARVPEGHYGLIGMKERAAKIGGRLDVESGPRGTVISIEWRAR
jgi:signal transduction histidine kinase